MTYPIFSLLAAYSLPIDRPIDCQLTGLGQTLYFHSHPAVNNHLVVRQFVKNILADTHKNQLVKNSTAHTCGHLANAALTVCKGLPGFIGTGGTPQLTPVVT